jgi:hypothetical protein
MFSGHYGISVTVWGDHVRIPHKLHPCSFFVALAAEARFCLAARNAALFGPTSCHAFPFQGKIMASSTVTGLSRVLRAFDSRYDVGSETIILPETQNIGRLRYNSVRKPV